MVCTEYQERINELALAKFGASFGATRSGATPAANGGTESDASLAQHLAACAGCRAELDQRRALLARIDSGVAAMVAVEPSPSLAVLVRQQIAEEKHRVTLFRPALGLVDLGRCQRRRYRCHHSRGHFARAGSYSCAISECAATQPSTVPVHPLAANLIGDSASTREIPWRDSSSEATQSFSARAEKNSQEAASVLVHEIESAAPSLEVLIPANQRIALVQLAAAGARNQLDERILVREAATTPLPAIEVKPLKIDLLKVLDPEDDDGRAKISIEALFKISPMATDL